MKLPARLAVVGVLVAGLATGQMAWAQSVLRGKGRKPGPCAPPPPPKRQAIASAEGKGVAKVAKLPCSPTRRTEKKSPPAPPTLVAKMSFGDNSNWQTDRDDVFNLLRLTKQRLNVEYRPTVSEFKSFEFDANKIPVLYFTGHYPFQFSVSERDKVRKFLLDGGTMIMDACCGSEDFYARSARECRAILPGADLRRLPMDHPVFWCYYPIEKVSYSPEVKEDLGGRPYIEGVDLESRTAIFVNKYDLSCGWDGHTHPYAKQMMPQDATRLGVNMLIYAASSRQYSRSLADLRAYREADKHQRGKVVMAEVVLSGEQPRSASAVSNLMATLSQHMPAKVGFRKVTVTLDDPKVFEYPLLLLSGMHDFTLTASQVTNLRKYLEGGGFLLAEARCGRLGFDRAFRREMARVFPKHGLKELGGTHPVYAIPSPVTRVGFSPALAYRLRDADKPQLEGITVGDTTAVVYSRYSLSCGWQETLPPYTLAYDADSALRLGVGILTYGLSH